MRWHHWQSGPKYSIVKHDIRSLRPQFGMLMAHWTWSSQSNTLDHYRVWAWKWDGEDVPKLWWCDLPVMLLFSKYTKIPYMFYNVFTNPSFWYNIFMLQVWLVRDIRRKFSRRPSNWWPEILWYENSSRNYLHWKYSIPQI